MKFSSIFLNFALLATFALATSAFLLPTTAVSAQPGGCLCVGPVQTNTFTGTGGTCEQARADAISKAQCGQDCDGFCVYELVELDQCPQAGTSFRVELTHQCRVCW